MSGNLPARDVPGAASTESRGPMLAGHPLRPHELPWRVAAAVVPGVMLTSLHAAIIDLPKSDVIDALATDRYRIGWVLGAYLLGAAVGMAMTGFWSSRMGLRRNYLAWLAIYIAASALCGWASEVFWMTPPRFVAGYATGQVITTAMLLLWRAFPANRELAMAFYGMGVYTMSLLGASVGGLLTAELSWRWIFWINLPLGAWAWPLGWTLLPRDAALDGKRRALDVIGFTLLALTVTTLIVVLDLGQYWSWFTSPDLVGWFAALALSLVGFVAWGVLADAPLIGLRPLASRDYGLGLCVKSLFSINVGVMLGLLSAYMISLRGYQWRQGALILLPGFAAMLLSILAGARWGRNGNRRARMFAGLAGMALVTWLIGARVDLYWSKWALAGLVTCWAACAGLVIGPAMLTIFERLPPAELPGAIGVFNILRTLPTFAVGSLLIVLLTRQTDGHFDRLRQSITRNRPTVETTLVQAQGHFTSRGSSAGLGEEQAQALIGRWARANARAYAFGTVLKTLSLLTAVGAVLTLGLKIAPDEDQSPAAFSSLSNPIAVSTIRSPPPGAI